MLPPETDHNQPENAYNEALKDRQTILGARILPALPSTDEVALWTEALHDCDREVADRLAQWPPRTPYAA
jgi:hypothetical protein